MQDQPDRIALVTGASGDIGAAISRALAAAGTTVIASGRDERRLAAVAAGLGTRIAPIPADLTDPAGPAALREAVERQGRLDLLVLGSGIYERSADPQSLARQFTANVSGPYGLLRAVRPQLEAAKGLIVFLNSTQGLTASAGLAHYAATQHALRAIADSTREEVNRLGVRVTTIYLGRTATARQTAIFAMEQRPYRPELLIQPADVAQIVMSLATLPVTSEVMEIRMRPAIKSY